MAASSPAPELYGFLPTTHPFYPHVERFATLLLAEPRYQSMITGGAGEEPPLCRTLIRCDPTPEGHWTLRGLYLSLQRRDLAVPLQFRARTFFYGPRKETVDCREFPGDPALTAAAGFFQSALESVGSQPASVPRILRYVPRRRLTFRTAICSGTNVSVVGKFLRDGELTRAYERLAQVSRAVASARCQFGVAAPMGIDSRAGVFFQEARPGQDLTTFFQERNLVDLLLSVGVVHHDIHQLPVIDCPEWNLKSFLRRLARHLDWVRFCCPEQGAFLEAVRELLWQRAPEEERRRHVFCHGEFRCAQILMERDHWSVVDFDAGVRADPYWEIGRFLAFLKHEIGWLRSRYADPGEEPEALLERAREAYLHGYECKSGRAVDRQRLLWYWICGEIEYLARRIRRDQLSPVALERTTETIDRLCRQLQGATQA
jgi:hypothetical protein